MNDCCPDDTAARYITAAGVFCPSAVAAKVGVITYRRSTVAGEDGSDVLTAALDPYGTEQAQDLYTYTAPAGTPVDHVAWSPSPIAPAGTLAPGQTAVVTVTAFSSHDSPIPNVQLDLLLGRTAGSDPSAASPCGPIPTAGAGLRCATGPDGTIQVSYHAPSGQLDGGSDALTATDGFPPNLVQSQDLYSFQ